MKKPLFGVFFGAFLAGTALIWGIRWLFPGLGGAMFAAVAAVAVVAGLWIYYATSKIAQPDRAADNLYYLGLLLTLVSLSYVLVVLFAFRPDAGDVQVRVDTLIGSFGIALISTVAGILGRLALQDPAGEGPGPGSGPWPPGDSQPGTGGSRGSSGGQGANEDESAGESAREHQAQLTAEMREAAANMLRLRRELREAADAFAHFTRVTLSHANHVKSHTQELLEGFNQHMAAVAERGIDDTGAVWRKVGEAMREDGEGLLRSIEAAASGAVERTEETWRGLVGQIDSASLAARNRLEANAKEMGQTLTQLETTNGALGSLASALDAAQRHVSTLAEKASGATAALDANAAETVAAQRALVAGTQASQGAALESFEAAAAALTAAVRSQMAEQTRAWQQAVSDFDAAAEAQRKSSEGALANAGRAIDSLVVSLGGAKQDITALGRAASGAAAGAEARAGEVLATLSALAEGAKEQQEESLRVWREAAARFSEDARKQLATEADAWRELLDGFDTAQSAKRLSAETSRFAVLIRRLDRLLEPANRNR